MSDRNIVKLLLPGKHKINVYNISVLLCRSIAKGILIITFTVAILPPLISGSNQNDSRDFVRQFNHPRDIVVTSDAITFKR